MQPALKSDQAVQSYIDAMLLDMGGAAEPLAIDSPAPEIAFESPPDTGALAGQSNQASGTVAAKQKPVSTLPGQQVPLASALVMPGLAQPQLKALARAIAQAPAKVQLKPIALAGTSPPADPAPRANQSPRVNQARPADPAPKPKHSDGATVDASSTSTNASTTPTNVQANPRSAAFLKHLEDAQARTAARLKPGVVGRKRPAALAKAPEWVQEEQLRCLVFKVANLQLALPVQYLSGVAPFDMTQIQALPAEDAHGEFAALCLGAIEDKLVLDTARLVMPERYAPAMTGQYRQVLQIADTSWYFAVDSIGSEQSFKAQDVRWRSQHTRREWLAGTVIDQMCAIVDVESLHRSLLAASVLESTPQ